ncbi:ABC transporter substrate-binding protein [Endozoicomonas sp. OPT23]|nr:ABC transporter substrate-binding protein [Endozoicomonas sp. OPT23]
MKKQFGQTLLAASLSAGFAISASAAAPVSAASTSAIMPWSEIQTQAKGQTVYFNAWGGSQQINDYIGWAASEIKSRYGVNLKQVKVDDTANVVSRILAEKKAGRDQNGSVDMVWINGENFKSMKQNNLLYGPFTNNLPSYKFIDAAEKPTTELDFGEPVNGLEAPWGMAQLVFIYDQDEVKAVPQSAGDLLTFAQRNPGRVTYPLPPDFIGTTFLKQLLLELSEDTTTLTSSVDKADFGKVTAPLWAYLDKLHPSLWREGKAFPKSSLALTPMLDDREIMLSMTFNPSYASSAIAGGELPETVRTYVHEEGTVGNTHFLAIPYNAKAKAGAQVVINFLMSPEAQARKANPEVWGDPTVLSMGKLDSQDRNSFDKLPLGVATLSAAKLGKVLPEPHSSWVAALEQEWQKRYRQ